MDYISNFPAAAAAAAAATKSLESCPTLCDPIDGSPPGSAGDQPRLIQGIRSGDGVGEDQETTA